MKSLIEAIEARIQDSKSAANSYYLHQMNVLGTANDLLVRSLEEIKQLAIAEQARLIKELEATISDAGNIIAVSHAIKIVKGEET